MTYRTLLLPKSHGTEETWRKLVLKQKALRLAALRASPQSFGSTYDREVKFEYDVWDKRLRKVDVATFIAIQSTLAQRNEARLLAESVTTDWMGTLVLAGPLNDVGPVDSLTKVPGAVATYEEEKHKVLSFQLNGMYVVPEARGAGIGKQLIRAAVEHAETMARQAGVRVLHLTLVVDYHNKMARTLYEDCGFGIARRYFFDNFRPSKHEEDPQGQTEAAVMERILVIDPSK